MFILGLLIGFSFVVRRMPIKARLPVFVSVAVLLATPSWAPATIVAVPIPFGVLFFGSFFGGFIHELPELLLVFWWWHLIAFPLVGLISYFVGRKVLFNKKPQPTGFAAG